MIFQQEVGEIFNKDEAELLSEDTSVFRRLASELPLSILKIPSQHLPFWERSLVSCRVPVHEEKGSVRGEELCIHVHCSHVL